MLIREMLEQREGHTLSPDAAFFRTGAPGAAGAGVRYAHGVSAGPGQILHPSPFRRLKHKTQVFLSPEGDHYRTRLTHTLEVAQIARTIARALRLNEDLVEAAALGHDLGHTRSGTLERGRCAASARWGIPTTNRACGLRRRWKRRAGDST